MTFRGLKMGDRIGFIAPAGKIKREDIKNSIEIFQNKGFKITLSDHLLGEYRYFSGTIEERLQDIHQFLEDPNIRGLYAVRGGMGSLQLLPALNYALWKKTKKILIGVSDVTALQWAVWAHANVVSFSGMAAATQLRDNNPYVDMFFNHLLGIKKNITEADLVNEELITAREGQSKGVLLGGTLSVLNTLLGTPYYPVLNKIILYIEDVNEPLYRIERALLQLKLAGMMNYITGVIFGRFQLNNEDIRIWPELSYLFPDKIPIVLNMPYGHNPKSCALPLGISARLSTNPFEISWD